MSIDLNADVAEGMNDTELLSLITSANVACALHAGDPTLMDQTVSAALSKGVRVGAHPGYPDRANFGRVAMEMSAQAVEDWVAFQVFALDGFVRTHGGILAHVKPHGALYHAGSERREIARAIAAGIRRVRTDLILIGFAGSHLIEAGLEAGLPVAEEGFADRRYLPNGKLMPRDHSGAVLQKPEEAAAQALLIAREGMVTAADGSRVAVRADTVCLHGDTPGAPQMAHAVRKRLEEQGIQVAPMTAPMLGKRNP